MSNHWQADVLRFLDENRASLYDLLIFVFHTRLPIHEHHRNLLHTRSADFLDLWLEQEETNSQDWASHVVRETCRNEILKLTEPHTGFRIQATKTSLEQIEEFSMIQLGKDIKNKAPYLWEIIGVLLDTNLNRRRVAPYLGRPEGEDVSMENLNDGDGEGKKGVIAGWEDLVDGNETSDSEQSEEQLPIIFESSLLHSDLESSSGEDAEDGEPTKKAHRGKKNPGKRHAILIAIKRIVIISILANNSNEQFNVLQSIIGFFCESKCTPEIVVEMLAHMGVCVSIGTTRNAVKSLRKHANTQLQGLPPGNMVYDNFDMDFKVTQPTTGRQGLHMSATATFFAPYIGISNDSDLRVVKELHAKSLYNKDLSPSDPRIYHPSAKDILPSQEEPSSTFSSGLDSLLRAFAWHIRAILVHHVSGFEQFKSKLSLPEEVDRLPVIKTKQFPANAINADEGTTDGNWEVLKNLLNQNNIPDDILEEHVTLVHGDLGTKEKIDSLQRMRYIEHTAKNRLGWVVFIPGLFHCKMACADAYWRIHVQPKAGRDDPTSFFEYIHLMRPQETGRFIGSPGFRRMHDTIHHATWIDIIDCWRLVALEHGHISLTKFAKSNPSWEQIEKMSERIVQTYLPGPDFQSIWEQPASEQDVRFENQALRKQHGLLYLEFSHAMSHGDVGRILRLIPYWIAIFTATKKNKYAAHMTKFKTDLDHVYSAPLRRAILNNWLCNPTGKPNGWRGYDWLMERNNLYTKVVFAGQGSNRTMKLVFKRSILIEVYRSVHQTIENNFYLTNRTIRHTSPKMTATLAKVGNHIKDSLINPHIFAKGRVEKYEVPDVVNDGFVTIFEAADVGIAAQEGSDAETTLTGGDLGVN